MWRHQHIQTSLPCFVFHIFLYSAPSTQSKPRTQSQEPSSQNPVSQSPIQKREPSTKFIQLYIQPLLPMSNSNLSIAWQGDGNDHLTPGQFLHEIGNKIDRYDVTTVTEARMVKCMRNNIAYGSTADDWFNQLGNEQTDLVLVLPQTSWSQKATPSSAFSVHNQPFQRSALGTYGP
jgi:hypothetical protein